MSNKQGRPARGVPKKTVESFALSINDWIEKKLLPRWLKDGDKTAEATEAYQQLDFFALDKHDQLTVWCQSWLSDEGWKRLQANARQKRYKDKERRIGPKFKRVSLERETAVDLEHFAASRKITVSEAVKIMVWCDFRVFVMV